MALPTFIYFKRQNDAKAREMYAQTRIKTGAMSQMSSGKLRDQSAGCLRGPPRPFSY